LSPSSLWEARYLKIHRLKTEIVNANLKLNADRSVSVMTLRSAINPRHSVEATTALGREELSRSLCSVCESDSAN